MTLDAGWLQSTIQGGKRSSSATSYLGPRYINRPNLHILVNTQVTRVLSSENNFNIRTVEFTQSQEGTNFASTSQCILTGEGPRQLVSAQKEVLLSAGTVGTPHILLNSGIGDERELAAVGIKAILHLPDVGQNLSDHPRLTNNWFVRAGGDTFDSINQNSTVAADLLTQWTKTQRGPLVDTFVSHLFFARLLQNSSVLRHNKDPAAGPNTPHYELGMSV